MSINSFKAKEANPRRADYLLNVNGAQLPHFYTDVYHEEGGKESYTYRSIWDDTAYVDWYDRSTGHFGTEAYTQNRLPGFTDTALGTDIVGYNQEKSQKWLRDAMTAAYDLHEQRDILIEAIVEDDVDVEIMIYEYLSANTQLAKLVLTDLVKRSRKSLDKDPLHVYHILNIIKKYLQEPVDESDIIAIFQNIPSEDDYAICFKALAELTIVSNYIASYDDAFSIVSRYIDLAFGAMDGVIQHSDSYKQYVIQGVVAIITSMASIYDIDYYREKIHALNTLPGMPQKAIEILTQKLNELTLAASTES